MTYIDSSKFVVKVNRSTERTELGENGRVQSIVYVYKGNIQLTPTNNIPSENQFRVTISSMENCSASIKNLNTIYVNYMNADANEGSITLDINAEGKTNFIKNIKLVKSVTRGSVTEIEKRISIAEQKITNDAIANVVKKEFYTKGETNTKMSLVEQTVDNWSARIVENEKTLTELKLTSEEFEVTIGNKADSSNIISTINASSEGIKIQASKINLDGVVTITDLSTPGATVISGSNITTGTIDARLANISNLNASNITSGTLDASRINVVNLSATSITSGTLDASRINVVNINADNITGGTISGDQIRGGTIYGATFQSTTMSSSGGVSIGVNDMQIGSTYFGYGGGKFKIEAVGNMSLSSMGEIHIMGGIYQSGTTSGSGTVHVHDVLRVNKQLFVNNKEITATGMVAVFG